MNDEVKTQQKSRDAHRPRRREFGADAGQYAHEVIEVSRVVRVVKGGRRFRFRASVLIGDKVGRVGFGIGKSKDVQQAVQKAQQQAEKNMISVSLHDGTIAHQVEAKFKAAHVLLKPARAGTGVIAGSVVRVVAELAGIRDLVAKVYGSPNKINNVEATLSALQLLRK
ncbi:MAG: 30S ribosomal protein S5 [Patescibacteria group bacterium]